MRPKKVYTEAAPKLKADGTPRKKPGRKPKDAPANGATESAEA